MRGCVRGGDKLRVCIGYGDAAVALARNACGAEMVLVAGGGESSLRAGGRWATVVAVWSGHPAVAANLGVAGKRRAWSTTAVVAAVAGGDSANHLCRVGVDAS